MRFVTIPSFRNRRTLRAALDAGIEVEVDIDHTHKDGIVTVEGPADGPTRWQANVLVRDGLVAAIL